MLAAKVETRNGSCALLHLVAKFGLLDAVRYLLEHGAELEAATKKGYTALHGAAWYGHLEVCMYLLEHGAETGAQIKNGSTALHFAAQGGHLKVVQ